MLIKGEVASLNHRDSAFLRPNLDSSLNLGVDRGVLTKLFKICPFLNFVIMNLPKKMPLGDVLCGGQTIAILLFE